MESTMRISKWMSKIAETTIKTRANLTTNNSISSCSRIESNSRMAKRMSSTTRTTKPKKSVAVEDDTQTSRAQKKGIGRQKSATWVMAS